MTTNDEPDRGRYVDVETAFTVSGESHEVSVSGLRTPKGERLEIAAEERLRIDALGLESLTWQGPEVFSELLGREYAVPDANSVADEPARAVTVSNEYARVEVKKLVGDEEYLEVAAPKKRQHVRLDAECLSALAAQDHELFSRFLETPHGPGE